MRRRLDPISPARLAVLERIRSGDVTVNALALSLGVSDNAVRLHLNALMRDRLVRKRGVRRSGEAGQPAAEYEVTDAGGVALSAAYPPALTALASALGNRLDARAARAVFLEAGRALAGQVTPSADAPVAARAAAAAALLESLGGHIVVEQDSRAMATLRGTGCPLAEAVRAEPATCSMIEGMLAAHTGLKVKQCCRHSDQPACCFTLAKEQE